MAAAGWGGVADMARRLLRQPRITNVVFPGPADCNRRGSNARAARSMPARPPRAVRQSFGSMRVARYVVPLAPVSATALTSTSLPSRLAGGTPSSKRVAAS